MKKICLLMLLFLGIARGVWADETYTFSCKDSLVSGRIKYAMIGSYHFSFNDCLGALTYDPAAQEVKSVNVRININSIASNCPFCNKVVVSKRLLNAAVFPYITYSARQFQKQDGHYSAQGTIRLHGISRQIRSPFTLSQAGRGQLTIKGDWLIYRHDFDIIWNKVLDHGGVMVGETVKVNWQVHAQRQR